MRLNRKWILVIALIMSVAMATGGTLAYLTSEDSAVNVMTLGNVEIEQLENDKAEGGFDQGQPLYPAYYPGDTLDWNDTAAKGIVKKEVTVENTGSSAAYVRTWFAFEAGGLDWDQFKTNFLLQLNDADTSAWSWQWDNTTKYTIANQDGESQYFIALATLKEALPVDGVTAPSLMQLAMAKTADNEIVNAIGERYTVLVLSQAMQTVNFENVTAAEALAIGFGDKNGAGNAIGVNHPWTDRVTILNSPVTADVTPMDPEEADISEIRMFSLSGSEPAKPEQLDCYYIFKAKHTGEEAAAEPYGDWHADFVVSFDQDVPAGAGGLAGNYAGYGWIGITAGDEGIPANKEYRLLNDIGGGAPWTYADICSWVQEFRCGAFDYNDALAGTTMTVQLCLFETDETGNVINTYVAGEYEHTFGYNKNNSN